MERVRFVEVCYYRSGKHVGTDVGMSLVRDAEGDYFVIVNEDQLHPVGGVQLQPALKAGFVKIHYK